MGVMSGNIEQDVKENYPFNAMFESVLHEFAESIPGISYQTANNFVVDIMTSVKIVEVYNRHKVSIILRWVILRTPEEMWAFLCATYNQKFLAIDSEMKDVFKI